MENLVTGIISVIMVIITTLIFYETLRLIWAWLPSVKITPRKRIILVVLALFAGHTISVWLYGILYWVLITYHGLGTLSGQHNGFWDTIYFSAVTYSSLGFGDVFPTGAVRMICGVEVLNGLVLIGWSVSFTYLAMEKFWEVHRETGHH